MTRNPHRSGENFGRSPALFGMRREAHGRKSLRFTRAAVALRSVCLNSKVRLPSFVLIGGHPIARTAVMVRIVVMSVLAALLAACSGSSRVEDIVPAWANTPPHPATQYSNALPLRPSRNKSQRNPRLRTLPKSSVSRAYRRDCPERGATPTPAGVAKFRTRRRLGYACLGLGCECP